MLRTGTSLKSQVQSFLTSGATFNPQTTLFTIWGGPNDLFLTLNPANPPTAALAAAQTAATNIASLVGELAVRGGARQILVPNLPDLGSTPFGVSTGNSSFLTQLSEGFNHGLAAALTAEQALLPGVQIYQADVFGAMDALIASPPAGLDVKKPCVIQDATGAPVSVCRNPDDHLFWDSVHPTNRGHQFLAEVFAQAVPEPATYALLGIGVALLMVVVRRRHV